MLSDKNKKHFVTFCAILGFLWLIMYAIPDIFVKLFDTTLGNAILLLTVVGVGYKHLEIGVSLAIVLVILFQFSHMSHNYMLL